jgi:hypothetical protein
MATCRTQEARSLQKENAIISATMRKSGWRMFIEVSFILLLFYTNLLMGEFERSGMGQRKGLLWAFSDIFTRFNFVVAIIGAVIGYLLVEFLRSRS